MARVTRIRDLQELLGFSLAEVRVVLDTEDVDVSRPGPVRVPVG
jgi:DNA-binding transcriptional MerR regulator